MLQWVRLKSHLCCSCGEVEKDVLQVTNGTVLERGTSDVSHPSVHVDREAMVAILSQYEDVVAAYLFGSAARDEAGPASDVDVAVLLDPERSPLEQVERQLDLMGSLDALADRPVQITVLNRASPTLTYQVLQDGLLLCERDPQERIAFEVRAVRIYLDLKPMLESLSERLISRIREEGLGRRNDRPSRALEAARRIRERLERTPSVRGA